MLTTRLLFGQVNSLYPRSLRLRTCSIENDFAFVSRMFFMTGNDIKVGIDNAKKSNDKKRTSGSNNR